MNQKNIPTSYAAIVSFRENDNGQTDNSATTSAIRMVIIQTQPDHTKIKINDCAQK